MTHHSYRTPAVGPLVGGFHEKEKRKSAVSNKNMSGHLRQVLICQPVHVRLLMDLAYGHCHLQELKHSGLWSYFPWIWQTEKKRFGKRSAGERWVVFLEAFGVTGWGGHCAKWPLMLMQTSLPHGPHGPAQQTCKRQCVRRCQLSTQ